MCNTSRSTLIFPFCSFHMYGLLGQSISWRWYLYLIENSFLYKLEVSFCLLLWKITQGASENVPDSGWLGFISSSDICRPRWAIGHEFWTKVVQLTIAQRLMCIFEAFGQVLTKIVFFGPRFSACRPDSATLFFEQTNIFSCIFWIRTRKACFLIVTFGKILQDGQKTGEFSIFRCFSPFSYVRFHFSVSDPVTFLFSSMRRIESAFTRFSNQNFKKKKKNLWFPVTRENQSFMKSHVHHLFQRPR